MIAVTPQPIGLAPLCSAVLPIGKTLLKQHQSPSGFFVSFAGTVTSNNRLGLLVPLVLARLATCFHGPQLVYQNPYSDPLWLALALGSSYLVITKNNDA